MRCGLEEVAWKTQEAGIWKERHRWASRNRNSRVLLQIEMPTIQLSGFCHAKRFCLLANSTPLLLSPVWGAFEGNEEGTVWSWKVRNGGRGRLTILSIQEIDTRSAWKKNKTLRSPDLSRQTVGFYHPRELKLFYFKNNENKVKLANRRTC